MEQKALLVFTVNTIKTDSEGHVAYFWSFFSASPCESSWVAQPVDGAACLHSSCLIRYAKAQNAHKWPMLSPTPSIIIVVI